jgi:hypothetical protein
MKKSILALVLLIISSSLIFASTAENGEESLIIPQSEKIYEDLYALANDGYITSVTADHFRYDPISSYEAAGYVCEAIINVAAKPAETKSKKVDIETLKKYYETYKTKATEIYGKTNELRAKIKEIEAILANADINGFKETVNEASAGMFDIEQEYKLTTFRGIPPFKVMGMLNVRWQDIQSFGISKIHHTSLGGTFMQLWTEGIVSPDVSFKLNLTFERPANEAEKAASYLDTNLPEFWGTGQRFLDKYTITLNLLGWRLSTGFFWDDITPFVAKQILSERPVLFDKDPYALEETARGHYENVFLHSFAKRGDIWSKHGFYGAGLYNMNLFGSMLKLIVGKGEKFEERWDKLYMYEFAGRWTYPIEIKGLLRNTAVSANFFCTANDRSEISTLTQTSVGYPDTGNFPGTVEGFIQSQTVVGGDFKASLIDIISLGGEIERSTYNGRLPKPYAAYPNSEPPTYVRAGNALYAKAGVDLSLLKLEVKYTQIDPDYVATASAVIDTANPTLTPPYEMQNYTYAGDPTMLWNNMKRMSIFGNISMPNGWGFILLNYGTTSQIRESNNQINAEHFLFGNRLNGALYWHLFYSNYGTPGAPPYPANMYDGFNNYNANSGGLHRMVTDKWLTNKEVITSNYTGQPETKKVFNNASIEARCVLNKIIGLENNLFVQGYGELTTLTDGSDFIVDFNPEKLFCQQLVGAFAVYNLTRKINLMATWGMERWVTDKCDIPVDYLETIYGVGFDYDFAPRTALFLRAKKIIHEDRVITANNFDGWQLFMELKNFF